MRDNLGRDAQSKAFVLVGVVRLETFHRVFTANNGYPLLLGALLEHFALVRNGQTLLPIDRRRSSGPNC